MDLARQPPDHSWRRAALLGTASGIGIALLARHLSPPAETRLHVTGPDGYVEASPAGLARAAGVDLDVYVLASAMQSEERSDRGRLAVGRAAWNAVGGRRDRLASKIIPSGRLGTQLVNPYADTRRPPTVRTLGLAAAFVEGRVPDFFTQEGERKDSNGRGCLIRASKRSSWRFFSRERVRVQRLVSPHLCYGDSVTDDREQLPGAPHRDVPGRRIHRGPEIPDASVWCTSREMISQVVG